MSLQESIEQWNKLAVDADERAKLGLTHPSVAAAQADCYRRAAKSLEIQRDTGVAVCSCCHKPFGDDKPYWMRGKSGD